MSGSQIESKQESDKQPLLNLAIAKLSTPIINERGEPVEVYAVSAKSRDYGSEVQYYVQLRTKAELASLKGCKNFDDFYNGSCLGSMTLWDKAQNKYEPSHIYIQRIDNLVSRINIKHVGSALEEFAFRFSVEKGREGRVMLQAAWNSHLFHYANGFRSQDESTNETLKKIQTEAKKTGERTDTRYLGSVNMYFPQATIEEKRKNWGITQWEVSVAKAQAENLPAGQNILVELPDELLHAGVLPLLTADDLFSLYNVSTKKRAMMHASLPEQLAQLSPSELSKLTFMALQPKTLTLAKLCLQQMKKNNQPSQIVTPQGFLKTAIELAVETNHTPLVQMVLEEGSQLYGDRSSLLWAAIEKNNLAVAELLIPRLDLTNLDINSLVSIIKRALNEKTDNKPLLQLLFDLINNYPNIGSRYNYFYRSDSWPNLTTYKILLASVLDKTEVLQGPPYADYERKKYDAAFKEAYELALASPNSKLCEAFLKSFATEHFPTRDYAVHLGKPSASQENEMRSHDIYLYEQGGKLAYVLRKSATEIKRGEIDLGIGSYARQELGIYRFAELESAIKYNAPTFSGLSGEKLKENLLKVLANYGCIQAEPQRVVSKYGYMKQSLPTVMEQAFKRAFEEKNHELIARLLHYAKENNLPLPWERMQAAATEAALHKDLPTLKLLFAYTPVERISDLACPAFRLHDTECFDSRHGIWKRKLDPEVLEVLKQNMDLARQKWIKVVDALLQNLADVNRYPEKTKGFITSSAHQYLGAKQRLHKELHRIKQLVETAYPRHYQGLNEELVQALEHFQKGVTDKKGAGERYLKSFFEDFGEAGRVLHADAYMPPTVLKEKLQAFVYPAYEEKAEAPKPHKQPHAPSS